jgi:hypothetical protein
MARLKFASMALAGEADAGAAGEQPARTTQMETHPRDERGRDRKIVPSSHG